MKSAYRNFGIYLNCLHLIPIGLVTGIINEFVLETIIGIVAFIIIITPVAPLSIKIFKKGSIGALFITTTSLLIIGSFILLYILKINENGEGIGAFLVILLGFVNSWGIMRIIYNKKEYQALIVEYMQSAKYC